MDLQPSQEQLILRDTATRFLADHYDYSKFRAISETEKGFSPEIWAKFADMGWLGLPFAEADGGLGGGAIEIAILMEAFGRALVLEPYLTSVVLSGGLVASLGSNAQRGELLPALIEGKLKLAFAHEDHAPTHARREGSGFVISGAKKTVLGAAAADQFLVSAALPGGGTGVFVVPANARGLTVRTYRTVDGGRAADLVFTDVAAQASALLGGNEDADASIATAIDRAIAAASADAVGAMATMVAATVDYTKTRVQFGQPIAKFQVLSHRMVDMKIREEEARATCLLATLSLNGPADRRARAICGAKAKIGRNARFIAQSAIQTHGAIGTTQELSLGAYAKRLMAYEMLFGATREHLRRYCAFIADPELAGASLLLESSAAA
jgi:alkylation response protein AidB-like acyl-CoA dehydrogenase